MTKERQLRKQEEIRNSILDTAREIIERDGISGLSIRKITNAIEYSPAIIYHYFKDKNEIVQTLVEEGYRKILSSIASVRKNEDEPEQEIREIFTKYIKAALSSPQEYMAFLMNNDAAILQKTALLQKGITKRSQTMQILGGTLKRGIEAGQFADCDTELSAQIIWTSTFGLIIKLILEKDIGQEQVDRLIEQHFKMLFYGIKNRMED